MEAHFSHSPRAPANLPRCRRSSASNTNTSLLFFLQPSKHGGNAHLLPRTSGGGHGRTHLRVSNGDSYLGMWKNAVEREKKKQEFEKIAENVSAAPPAREEDDSPQAVQGMTDRFQRILEVPKEERDRVQQMQVIDRAAAAIAAARALLQETPPPAKGVVLSADTESSGFQALTARKVTGNAEEDTGSDNTFASPSDSSTTFPSPSESSTTFASPSKSSVHGTPGPDFWSWSPPLDDSGNSEEMNTLKVMPKAISSPNPVSLVMEKDHSVDILPLPLQSTLFEGNRDPSLPPFQSFIEVEKVDTSSPLDTTYPSEETKLDILFSTHAEEAAAALHKDSESPSHGVNPDGSKWWKETGIEQRPNGIACKWTLKRGVSADGSVEWENKYWEAADQFEYKELGSEKSGRDAAGNVWREYWKEVIWQDHESGLLNIEKTADKWGTTGKEEWQEKWREHYDVSGQTEKWAHKWCCIDPNALLEAGHAHVWHERWGEQYDGHGGSMKYTDKWAERLEGDAWTKWGDKWDEHFDRNGRGVKQGETWWKGKYGEQWNRTWGEGHNGSGWVHKYGKSSSGEHWDTHVPQETWYERYPHYGFELAFKNSVQLRQLQRPSETA